MAKNEHENKKYEIWRNIINFHGAEVKLMVIRLRENERRVSLNLISVEGTLTKKI